MTAKDVGRTASTPVRALRTGGGLAGGAPPGRLRLSPPRGSAASPRARGHAGRSRTGRGHLPPRVRWSSARCRRGTGFGRAGRSAGGGNRRRGGGRAGTAPAARVAARHRAGDGSDVATRGDWQLPARRGRTHCPRVCLAASRGHALERQHRGAVFLPAPGISTDEGDLPALSPRIRGTAGSSVSPIFRSSTSFSSRRTFRLRASSAPPGLRLPCAGRFSRRRPGTSRQSSRPAGDRLCWPPLLPASLDRVPRQCESAD